ncbi:NUDIX domain-containing protein [Streptomyces abyssomicinicus]|uniref:NUDIX domain-containing protein n=1 Tax=Streptomyces abyssomicinicus TaxID=574929 RepID=UPI0013E074B3|nr:NUDIX hydrolase [Streptomyces abyssomicinicus]
MGTANTEGAFDVLATRQVYTSPYMRLREDDVRFPDGSPGVWSVLERSDFALVVPEVEPGRLAMVNLYRHPVGRRFWEFPQGSAATPGVPPQETAAGELREEAGLAADEWHHLGLLHEAYGYATGVCHVYLARSLTTVGRQPEPGEGDVRFGLFDIEEIWRMQQAGDVTDAVTVAALGLYERTRRGIGPRPGQPEGTTA